MTKEELKQILFLIFNINDKGTSEEKQDLRLLLKHQLDLMNNENKQTFNK